MQTKSCLKSIAKKRPGYSRTVSFRGDDAAEVHMADDWDRSPVDVTPKLTYEDILELKQMQVDAARALARAQAAACAQDISSGGTGGKFAPTHRTLVNVPITLLPLLPPSPATSTPSALSESCSAVAADGDASGSPCGMCSACIRRARSGSYSMHTPPDTPPRTTIKSIPAPVPPRARNFAFLPLLEASPSADSSSPPPQPQSHHPSHEVRWTASLDSDVDESSGEEDDGWPSNWPGARRNNATRNGHASTQMNMSGRGPFCSPSSSKPNNMFLPASLKGKSDPVTPPSPPAEADRPNATSTSYFAPISFKAGARGSQYSNVNGSPIPNSRASTTNPSSPLQSSSTSRSSNNNLASCSSTTSNSPNSPRALKGGSAVGTQRPPQLQSQSPQSRSRFPPSSPTLSSSPRTDDALDLLLDWRKCSLQATTASSNAGVDATLPKAKTFKLVPLS